MQKHRSAQSCIKNRLSFIYCPSGYRASAVSSCCSHFPDKHKMLPKMLGRMWNHDFCFSSFHLLISFTWSHTNHITFQRTVDMCKTLFLHHFCSFQISFPTVRVRFLISLFRSGFFSSFYRHYLNAWSWAGHSIQYREQWDQNRKKTEQKQWNLWVGKDVKAVGGLAQKIERKKEICHRTSSRNHKT